MVPLAAFAAAMSTPGAVMSGLMALSAIRGPRLENGAIASAASTAPTVSAASAEPGLPRVVSPGPEFPAAITNSAPLDADRASTACSIGSVPGLSDGAPRLMLTMSAPWSTAHRMPSRIAESWQ